MRELEGQAEAPAGTFTTQNVANTLWAYATVGREPGAGMLMGLEGRAEALTETFTTQQTHCGRMRRWGGSPGLD
jgi:hypothetical protein